MDRLAATLAGMSMIGSVQMVAAILSCAVLALIFLVLLKLVDAFREMAFEARQTQRSIEEQTARIQAQHGQRAQAAARRDAPAQRRQRGGPPLAAPRDEILAQRGRCRPRVVRGAGPAVRR